MVRKSKYIIKTFYIDKLCKYNFEANTSLNAIDDVLSYNLLDDIKQISTTKKSLWSLENKKYTFLVSPWISKTLIKLAIEKFFNVRVRKVNTSILPLRKKYVGRYTGFKKRLKKAIVTLDIKDEISLFSDI